MVQDRAKRIRQAAGLSQVQASVLAGISLTTWRVFERTPSALRTSTRKRCEQAMLRMAQSLSGQGQA